MSAQIAPPFRVTDAVDILSGLHRSSPNAANARAITSGNGENTGTASDRDDALHLLDHDTCRPIFADRRARRFSSFDNDSCQHRAPRSGSYLFLSKRSQRCPKPRRHPSQANKSTAPMSTEANKPIVIA